MANKNIIDNAKSFIDRVSKSRKSIPDSTNIGEQLTSALDSVIQGIVNSTLGKASLGQQLDIVKKNSEALKPLIDSVFNLLKYVSDNLKPSTLLQISVGMKLLGRVNVDPMISLMNTISKGLEKNKLLTGNYNENNNPLVNFNLILESIQSVVKPENVRSLIIGTRLLKLVKLDPVWEFLKSITDNIKSIIGRKSFENTSKEVANLTSIVVNIRTMIATIGATSLLAIMVAPLALIGLPLVDLLLRFTIRIVQRMASFNKKQQDSIAEGRKAILAIGATFTLFALTIYLIGEAATDPSIWRGLIAFTALVGATVGLLFVLGHLDKMAKDGAKTILAIGATFTLFALTVILIGEAAMDEGVWEGFGMFAALVGIAVGLLFLLGSRFTENITREGGLTLLLIGATFSLFALTVILLGEAAVESWDSFWLFAAIVGVAVGTLLLVSLAKGEIIPGAAALAIIAGSFIVFIGVMALLQVLRVGEDMWINFGQMLLVVVAAGAVCAGLGAISWLIIPGAIALGAIAVSLLLASTSLLAVSYIIPLIKWDELIDSTWKLAGFMWRISVVCTESLVLGLIAIPGLAVLLAISTSLFIVSVSLLLTSRALSKIDWRSIIDSISSENGVEGLLKAIAGIVNISTLKDLAKVMLICPVLMTISISLRKLAEGLQEISKLDVNLDEVTLKASNIITTLISVFAKVAQEPEVSALLNEKPGFFGQSTTSKMIRLAKDVSTTISELAIGVADMANLTVTEYDKNGNVKSKRQLNDADFTLAGNNIGRIITNVVDSISTLNSETIDDLIATGLFGGKTRASKVLDIAYQVGDVVANLATTVAMYANNQFVGADGQPVTLSEDGYEKAATNIGRLIKSCVGQFSDDSIATINDKKLNGIKSVGEAINNITTAVNKVDVSKLDKMTSLAETMLKFGEGVKFNLDGLAEIINGKLVESIDDLKEALEKVDKTFTDYESSSGGGQSETPATNVLTGEPGGSGKTVSNTEGDKNKVILTSIDTSVSTISTEIKKLTAIINKSSGMKVEITNEPLKIKKTN